MTADRRSLARVPWRTVATRPVYVNPWIRVREDVAELPDGHRTLYGVVESRPSVGVLPFLDADTVVLVGQYRYVVGSFQWEIPTGSIHDGESETTAVQRELGEEAGYRARHLRKLCTFDTSKSVLDERAHIYAATDLTPVRHEPDVTEFIEAQAFRFDDVLGMVLRSEIVDAMTVVAVLHAARGRTA